MLAITPGLALAEVSDKEPTSGFLWSAGLMTALLCFIAARFKPWLGILIVTVFAVWCATISVEIHSNAIMPYLIAEQGVGYYVQAYLASGLPFIGGGLGILDKRRTRHRK